MIKKFLKSILFKDVGDPSDIAVTNEWARYMLIHHINHLSWINLKTLFK